MLQRKWVIAFFLNAAVLLAVGLHSLYARAGDIPLYAGEAKAHVLLPAALTIQNSNDIDSLHALLGLAGLHSSNATDVSQLDLGPQKHTILVLPGETAAALSAEDRQRLLDFVHTGGCLLTFGKSELSRELGIVFSGQSLEFKGFRDALNPGYAFSFAESATFDIFSSAAGDVVMMEEADTGFPLVLGRNFGLGKFIHVGTSSFDTFTPFGTHGFPYLVYHVSDFFGLRPVLEAEGLDIYFDPGNHDLEQVSVEELVEEWAERGVSTVYCAAWHFWRNETGALWVFDYENFIRACRLRGLRVYAWFAPPHVSQQFWTDYPECRELNGAGDEVHEKTSISWRLPINLQNVRCKNMVLGEFRRIYASYDWDGVNLAELYYDFSFDDPEYFTPMNDDIREAYGSVTGIDPIQFFNASSPYYFQKASGDVGSAWASFLRYRDEEITQLHRDFLELFFAVGDEERDEVIITLVDTLNDGYLGVALEDLGVDAHAVAELGEEYDFSLQLEDHYYYWGAPPGRYESFRTTWMEAFETFGNAPDRIYFDINVFEAAALSRPSFPPGIATPSDKQTGQELLLLLGEIQSENERTALYAAGTLEGPDFDFIPRLFAAGSSVERLGEKRFKLDTKGTVRFTPEVEYDTVFLDGKLWPCAGLIGDKAIVLPGGSGGILELRDGEYYSGMRLTNVKGELQDATALSEGIRVHYASPRKAAVLTIEDFTTYADPDLTHLVLVDGVPRYNVPAVFYGVYNFSLPKGSRQVDILSIDAGDSDGDELPDAAEGSLGSDPFRADSDGDGIHDGWEFQYGFSPTAASDAHLDPDGDNLSNSLEFRCGSDPTDPMSRCVPAASAAHSLLLMN
jgi:hypothetical protein